MFLGRQHLSLLNVPNKTLLEMKDYVPQASHSSYHDTLLASLEIFVSSIDQVKLKEKVRNEIVKEQIEGKFRTIRTAFEVIFSLFPENVLLLLSSRWRWMPFHHIIQIVR